MEIIAFTFIAGVLLGLAIMLVVARKQRIGDLKVLWDRVEHQPYIFLQLNDPDITEVTSKKYVVLRVDKEIEFSQK